MSRRKAVFAGVSCAVVFFVCAVTSGRAQEPKQCDVIRDYLLQVDNLSVYTFGDERETKLVQAQTAFKEKLAAVGFTPSKELLDLITKYIGLAKWGHDRLRKGDARLLVKARAVQDKIKKLCPWE
jgi:hypothetical protein